MVKPIRTLLLLFYVACISGVIMILSPKELPLNEDISLKVFSLDEIAPAQADTTQANIANLLSLQEKLDSLENPQQAQQNKELPQNNPVQQKGSNNNNSTTNNSLELHYSNETRTMDSSRRVEKYEPTAQPEYPIQYPEGNAGALDNFFASLKYNQLIRIVHYGDSQLEGDRVTSALRRRMQQRFGGCGVGLVPLMEKQAIRSTISTRNSSNISRFSVLDNKKNKPRYGLLGAYFRFDKQAWVNFSKTSYDEGELPTKIENIKFVYASQNSIKTQIQIDKDSTISTELRVRTEPTYQEIGIKTNFKQLQISWQTDTEPEIYGIALDCNQGIAVDNVALRGMSVVDFSKTNREFLEKQLESMNVKLIILQFGVNVVPNPVKNYDFYEKMFYNQLKYIKSVAPDVSVLVVGVSDMARRSGTGYASYPNVPLIREAQKRAAFNAGCAFWDLYEAMGGANSMVAWVRNKPPLANTDYTHFNARGAKFVGDMLYKALMNEYENYKKMQ